VGGLEQLCIDGSALVCPRCEDCADCNCGGGGNTG
jgi:hypothetical protein